MVKLSEICDKCYLYNIPTDRYIIICHNAHFIISYFIFSILSNFIVTWPTVRRRTYTFKTLQSSIVTVHSRSNSRNDSIDNNKHKRIKIVIQEDVKI